ncbi:NADP-dependent phosphogluconate dehydrogenase [uncultured Cohaesibacter sp.]|uniref:NADP-dependent phosphogluconate dehydrogenase n=1 Tax=uncultured Cohaesibacter sp. TaxID=1002546 RepID=UPI0029C8BE7D|nr:NADP-dependent phosphogluconate dehydrogenase [uncultured Cohaesibacter sp.]
MKQREIGIIGLGVMGQNLALNIAQNGYGVAAFDPWEKARTGFAGLLQQEDNRDLAPRITVADDADAFLASLASPRIILLMVKAGSPVDDLITRLRPSLGSGDVVIDGGNSHYEDTIRRQAELQQMCVHYIGLGVSGGYDGARHGPSMMAGGDASAYRLVQPIFESIAASFEGEACCAHVGMGGAGHFVKMVHNGIEYAIMQIIAEAYMVMRDVYHLDISWCSRIFSDWNEGPLGSYLMEIAARVLQQPDDLNEGGCLVEAILDVAEQKGTGRWSVEAALKYGIPASTISEAVFARAMASQKSQRVSAAAILPGPDSQSAVVDCMSLKSLQSAVFASVIVAYAQGFALIKAATEQEQWGVELASVAKVWRSGCIVRSKLLDAIVKAYEAEPDLGNLLCSDFFVPLLADCQNEWRTNARLCAEHAVAAPVMSAALSYYDGCRTARSSANMLQGLRDCFGAHTYRRSDREGIFHTEWK